MFWKAARVPAFQYSGRQGSAIWAGHGK